MSEERNAKFIRRADSAKNFFQTVAMFTLCVAGSVTGAVMDLPRLLVMFACLSTLSGTLGALWVIERFDLLSAASTGVPSVLRSIPFMVIALVLATLVVVVLSLNFGALAGLAAHPLLYAAEFYFAVALRSRRVKIDATR